jgi:hypothetical protein
MVYPRIVSTDLDGFIYKAIDCPPASPEHLVGLEEEGWRDGQAQGLGGRKVDDQLDLCGLFDGEVGRLGSFEDLNHVCGGAPLQVRHPRRI